MRGCMGVRQMLRIARLFVTMNALLLVIACGRPDDPAKPPIVALPPEAATVSVFLDPEIRWAKPYNDGVRDWGRRLMLELPVELKAHGFTMTPERETAAGILAVHADAGTSIMSPLLVALEVTDPQPGHGSGRVAVSASEPEYAARALVNDLVASTYFNELARRHVTPRDSD